MSLLDDVSIVVTPNGYKAGTLFAVKPTIAYGSELVVNGDFSQGATGWTIEAVWTISGGAAHGNGANGSSQELKQTILEVGKSYEFSYEIRNRVSGSVELLNSGLGSTSSNEVYKSIGIATSTELRFRPSSFNGEIYNVSVREFTGADMDVTRATAATRVDENGLVNYAEVIGGEEVVNGDFTQLPLGTGWDAYTSGSSTVAFTEGAILSIDGSNSNVGVYQQNIFTSGVQYKIVVSVKATASFDALVSETDAASSKGTIGTLNLTTSYQDFSFYYTGTGTWDLFIHRKYGETAGQNQQIYIKDVSVKEVTRDNVPRIDYTGGGCPHILAEPMRTNLVTESEDFTTWSIARATLGTNITAPNGEADGYSIIATAVNDDHFVYKSFSVVNTTVYTYSAYLKKGSKSWARLWNTSVGYADFDLENGVVGTQSSVVGSIDLLNNGWYRCSIVYTAVSTGINSHRIYTLDGDNDKTFLGDGSTINLYTFGAQLEEGSYATSYIPTSGSTVTRNQDIFTRDGIGSLINSTEGVLFVEMAALSNDLTNRSITISDGTSNNRLFIKYDNSSNILQTFVIVGGAVIYFHSEVLVNVANFIKVGLKWKENDFSTWKDGFEIDSQLSGISFASNVLDSLNFAEGVGNSDYFYGKVKQLQVYTTALTDTQLAALTS